jgi:hypothetical protein
LRFRRLLDFGVTVGAGLLGLSNVVDIKIELGIQKGYPEKDTFADTALI